MAKPVNGTRDQNIAFYEEAYSGKNVLRILAKQLLSYDQLSKSKRNIKLATSIPEYSASLSILDYGFGLGTLLTRLPRRHEIYGVELSTEAIRNLNAFAKFLRRKVTLHQADSLNSCLPSHGFDLIFCSHVIEHIDDEGAALNRFNDLLREDGWLLINVPINEVWVDPNHVRKYTRESAVLALSSCGFSAVSAIEADRWTGWILHHEFVTPRWFKKPLFKAIRLLLGTLPVWVWDTVEGILPRKYKSQQLLILAQKKATPFPKSNNSLANKNQR